jgi:hypothetical protein
LVFHRPDGRRIHAAGSAPECFRGNILADKFSDEFSGQFSGQFSDEVLRAEHAELGLDIDAATSRSRWRGEPMDYGLAIEAMWRQRGGARAAAPTLGPTPTPMPMPTTAPTLAPT